MNKPHKAEILNEITGQKFELFFENKADLDTKIAEMVSKNLWGEPEREVPVTDFPEELTDRIIETRIIPATETEPEIRLHKVKCDYVITQTNLNLSKTHRNAVKKEQRKSEYPSLEEILHIILDHGLESQELVDLQTLRQSIKDKYPLES
jgi:hypothetical protein